MSTKKNVLVFPCGSEIAFEVKRSLVHSTRFNLIGGNSLPDHGRFVFDNYIGNIPFADSPSFIPAVKRIVKQHKIDIIYPAMESAIAALKSKEEELGAVVIASPAQTARLCLSKAETYKTLGPVVRVPEEYKSADEVRAYPVFCKAVVGYGARGAKKVDTREMLLEHLKEHPDHMILEYLPGEEYTVDCFTDRRRQLLFCGPRLRQRVSNGISVHTYPYEDKTGEIRALVEKINRAVEFRGAWFAQFKRNAQGEAVLLEIASRLGGSSALFRAKGVNFAQMSLFDALGFEVSVLENTYGVEMDRALDNKYKLDLSYNEVFMDYDDTVIVDKDKYNTRVMQFICQCKNKGIKLSLLTSHEGDDLEALLDRFGLRPFFDRVIHISKNGNKGDFIDNPRAVFIDDSFAERKRVAEKAGIPVFSVDMVEALMD